MLKYTLLLFGLIFSVHSIHAQTINGRVLDSSSQEPLQGASVIESGTTNGTSTDRNGDFSLSLSGESDQISVRYIGYLTQTITLSGDGDELEIIMERQPISTGEVFVSATRVDDSTPIAYSNISRAEIESNNLGQDIPFLIDSTPSVVSTSDAGAGIGYTGLRIRGVDPGRINVTINGIPVNDSESHGVFWVNMPDLASSTQNIQIQRGVGTSTQGAGAFGGSMNLQTANMKADPYGEFNTSVGSFGTQKFNIQMGSGIMDNGWQFEGRLSKIDSDGFIDRASSDLQSYYLTAARHGDRSLLKADVFSGSEVTYQAWNGIPEPILENDAAELEHYINTLFLDQQSADHLRDNLGNRQFNEFTYQNQVDEYQQDHYQLHYSYKLTDHWIANASLHYTYGSGFFEEFQTDDDLSNYNINPVEVGNETIESSDLIRRRWLDNHFYGTVFSTEFEQPDNWTFTLGGGYNEYDGDHFGEVIWSRFAGDSDLGDQYYNNNGFKTDFNVYGKLNYYFTDDFNLFTDLQYRTVSYKFLGLQVNDQTGSIEDVAQQDRINFFNPKVGLVYNLADGHRTFASLSVGGKEPTRSDYVDSSVDSRPDAERLFDYEAGYSGTFNRFDVAVNLYYMLYKDQLVLTGAVNDVGSYVRENVSDSYRAGIELETGVRISDQFLWSGNATFSQNKIDEYVRFIDDYDQGGQQSETFESTDIAFSPGIIANSIFTYHWEGLTSEWTSKYVGKQYLDNTQNDSRSIDPYWVNDLRFSYGFENLPYVGGINFALQINNVLDQEYVSNGYTFGYVLGGEQNYNYYYPQAGRNILASMQIRF
ncbi:MAG: TonB-dependent receptor [Balneolaceae bacterium]